jgi:Cd2+/Zn2+-exporting ATPase
VFCLAVVVVTAILIAVIPLAAGSHRTHHWIYLALVLLVVACPCALVISTPVTTTCGIAQAARSGLLVRGGSHLESLAKVKVLAMDKTGTLTEGHFRVLDVHSIDKTTSLRQILYWWVVT